MFVKHVGLGNITMLPFKAKANKSKKPRFYSKFRAITIFVGVVYELAHSTYEMAIP